jgi:hypothetical protein
MDHPVGPKLGLLPHPESGGTEPACRCLVQQQIWSEKDVICSILLAQIL